AGLLLPRRCRHRVQHSPVHRAVLRHRQAGRRGQARTAVRTRPVHGRCAARDRGGGPVSERRTSNAGAPRKHDRTDALVLTIGGLFALLTIGMTFDIWQLAWLPIPILSVVMIALGCLDRYGRRSEEHTSELQSRENLVCRLL